MDELVYFYPHGHQLHYEAGHSERPERVEVIRQALEDAGWWQPYPKLEPVNLPLDFVSTVHSVEYLRLLEAASQHSARLDADTYTTRHSWPLALKAAGGTAAVAQAVWTRQARRGFALSRPPGHHATQKRGMGFCLLNNIALAAQYLTTFPLQGVANARRLAIIDLDLHHGNGTQDIFWKRGDVFFFSTHQVPLYPGTGSIDEIGAGQGEGYTANFPLPPATGDTGFLEVMQGLILPLLDRYQPEMLLVSAGFDPHWRDPLGQLMLSAGGYARLIALLTGWAERHCYGKIMIVLEGGYDLEASAACGQAVVASLLGEPFQDRLGPSPRPEGHSWRAVAEAAKSIWNLT